MDPSPLPTTTSIEDRPEDALVITQEIPEDQWVARRDAAAQLQTSKHTIEKWCRSNEIPWRYGRGPHGQEVQVPLWAVDERKRTGKPTRLAGRQPDAPLAPSAIPPATPALDTSYVAVPLETWERLTFNLGALAERGLSRASEAESETREWIERASKAEAAAEAAKAAQDEIRQRAEGAEAEVKRLNDLLVSRRRRWWAR
jgi:hypothetical protein